MDPCVTAQRRSLPGGEPLTSNFHLDFMWKRNQLFLDEVTGIWGSFLQHLPHPDTTQSLSSSNLSSSRYVSGFLGSKYCAEHHMAIRETPRPLPSGSSWLQLEKQTKE